MILGIGIDVVDIERFSRSVDRWGDRFISRILTSNEIDYCHKKAFPNQSMAVRFAAKEAVFKCLSEAFQQKMRWHDIEVFTERTGRPQIHFLGDYEILHRDHRVMVSLSHMGDTAIAVVIIEKMEGR